MSLLCGCGHVLSYWMLSQYRWDSIIYEITNIVKSEEWYIKVVILIFAASDKYKEEL